MHSVEFTNLFLLFSEHLQNPEDTLKALFRSKTFGGLPGHILSIYLQNGMKLFGFIASKELQVILREISVNMIS